MFLLDSLLVSGIRWTLDTIRTAARHEMDDDSALRDRLMEAEMRRELGEIAEEEFSAVEADVLARMRVIRERRGGPDAIGIAVAGGRPGGIVVEAAVAGEFYDPAGAADVVLPPASPPPEPEPASAALARRPAGRPRRPMRRRTSAPGPVRRTARTGGRSRR